jgi:hypothetical protein
VRKLISIGLIIVALAATLVPAVTGGMIIGGGGGGGSQPYTVKNFYHTESGASIGGWVKAIEADNNRELKLIVWANAANNYYCINDLQLVVALWSEGNPVLYRTYHHQEDINYDVGYWDYTLSVKEDGMIDSPEYGLAYVWSNGDHIQGYWKMYAVHFIDGAAPEIDELPGVIWGTWSMYQTLETLPSIYG